MPTINAGELLNGTMINLDQPSAVSQKLTLGFAHSQPVRRPMFRVAVWVNGPKYFDHAITTQMNRCSSRWDDQLPYRLLLTDLQTDLAVALQPVSQSHPKLRTSFRLSRRLYQLSNATSPG